ncbi:uncharacterized protein LOC118435845 [Folsomia candida]|uniref:F-box domain-containing protein n=1 Tax=Folsomia candida TaxID=158441 RepID=A0A226EAU4_FOLCA|nr:uncharacterized protein LOC118435845 [Folsomia candida]OXA53931.1 hypothetical protein Fcan01_10268 [Folsomia candida]
MEGEDAILLEPNYRYCHSCRKHMWGPSSCGCATAENYAGKEWKQYSILPYIENQKYTFGTKYTSRDHQGEFIFVQTEKNPGNLAEINCSGGNYWITPAGKRVVLVNDARLEKNCRTKLNDGDKIALLGKVRPRRGLYPWIKHESLHGFFLFKEGRRAIERQEGEDPSMSDDEDKVNFTPGQNYLILSHIFSYLPFDNLKTARLVCSKWDEEAARILKKKSTVAMDLYSRYNYQYPMGSMTLLRYAKEMENLHPTSLHLNLPRFTSSNYRSLKLVDDLNWFLLLDRCRHITRLNLGGAIFSGSDYKMHLGILTKLQATLCDLELSWQLYLRDESSGDHAFLTKDLNLNKLEVFTYSITTGHEEDVLANEAVLSYWAAAVQRVKRIQLKRDVFYEWKFFNCLLHYEQPFPQLEAFIITPLTQQIVLDLLLKLTNPLKMLKVHRLRQGPGQYYAKFEKLLQKHADTLEELHFVYDRDEALHLPTLPRLRTLSVGCMQLFGLNIRFPSAHDNNDVLDYERHLPRLAALSLSMFPSGRPNYSWEHHRDKLEVFVPTRNRNGEPIETRCVTLRKLDLRIYTGYGWISDCFFRSPSDPPLTSMFPNVWNDWMTRRRMEEAEESLSATFRSEKQIPKQ